MAKRNARKQRPRKGGPSTSAGHKDRDSNKKGKARSYNTRSKKSTKFVADERVLKQQLKIMGLYAAHTLGDGNCLFRALSDQYHGSPDHHLIVRQQVCDYLEKNAALFQNFVGTDPEVDIDTADAFAQHLEEMRQSGTYGAHIEIQAWSNLSLRSIKVIQPDFLYVVNPMFPDDSSIRPPPILKSTTTVSARETRKRKREALKFGSVDPNDLTESNNNYNNNNNSLAISTTSSTTTPSNYSSPPTPTSTSNSNSTSNFNANNTEFLDAPLYIVYHDWEHYSSARNLDGPHAGMPLIRVREQPDSDATSILSFDEQDSSNEDEQNDLINQQDEQILRASLRFPEHHDSSQMRKMLHDKGLDYTLEFYIDKENQLENSPGSNSNSNNNNNNDNTNFHEEQIVSTPSSPGTDTTEPLPISSNYIAQPSPPTPSTPGTDDSDYYPSQKTRINSRKQQRQQQFQEHDNLAPKSHKQQRKEKRKPTKPVEKPVSNKSLKSNLRELHL